MDSIIKMGIEHDNARKLARQAIIDEYHRLLLKAPLNGKIWLVGAIAAFVYPLVFIIIYR